MSDARRIGDRDPDTAIIADTIEVIGDLGYGSLIMDKTLHRNVEYVLGENETIPGFANWTVSMLKNSITLWKWPSE